MSRVWLRRVLILLVLMTMGGIAWVNVYSEQGGMSGAQAPSTTVSGGGTFNSPALQAPVSQPTSSVPDGTSIEWSSTKGLIFYSERDPSGTHIWVTAPGSAQPIQLTAGFWEDKDPAVSPDGSVLAFTSNRSGQWDLYLLDLKSGSLRPLTQTNGYEAHPTWSPDGLWLAYEAYYEGDFDIWILPADLNQDPIQLTDHPGMDISPSWDPKGRRIAFISNRDGNEDVYIANLDTFDQRYINLSQTPDLQEADPEFRPGGSGVAYSVRWKGLQQIFLLDPDSQDRIPKMVGQGQSPVWSPDGAALLAILHMPDTAYVMNYAMEGGVQALGTSITGRIKDLAWSWASNDQQIMTSGPMDLQGLLPEPHAVPNEAGRYDLVSLQEVLPGGMRLSDWVDERFYKLRERTIQSAGWDFLKQLEQAFVGINDPLPPGYAYNDWLYTGRAFQFNRAALQAEWVEVVKEEYLGETYWRVFVRCSVQDGTLGEPLRLHPWDFNARFQGDPRVYDQGGKIKESIPAGYYIDFTELAQDFGFHRFSALPNWRTYYQGARFDEFAFTQGLTWEEAMLEIYPPSAILTPTPYRTPTRTPTHTPSPTPTPWWWRWRTPTPSVIHSLTPTAVDSP